MSTKTTFKRVALVAVAALGLGVVTSVAPASAADNTITATGLTIGSVGAVQAGTTVKVPVTLTLNATTTDTITVAAKILSAPAGSLLKTVAASGITNAVTTTLNNAAGAYLKWGTASSGSGSYGTVLNGNYNSTSATAAASAEYILGALDSKGQVTLRVNFVPDVSGTYVIGVSTASATGTALSSYAYTATDISGQFTVTTAGSATQIALTPFNASAATGSTGGALVKVTLKDATGAASTLTTGQTLRLSSPSSTVSFETVKGYAASGVEAFTNNALDYNNFSSGSAWILVQDTATENVTVTVSTNAGFDTVITQTTTLSFQKPTTTQVATTVGLSTGDTSLVANSSRTTSTNSTVYSDNNTSSTLTNTVAYTVSTVNATPTLKLTHAAAPSATYYGSAIVYDISGSITGVTGAVYSVPFSLGTTDTYATISVPAKLADTKKAVVRISNASADSYVELLGASATQTTLTVTPGVVRAATKGAITFKGYLVDQFGVAVANQAVAVTVAGRNATTTATNLVTDAAGYTAGFTLTDAGSSGTVDTVTFNTGTVSGTASITWSDVAIGTVTVTGGATADVAPAKTWTPISSGNIGYSTSGAVAFTATVKDASGNLLSGVPVTFTVDKGLLVKTATVDYATVYTGADGTAVTYAFNWITEKQTVTATAGGKTGTGYANWRSETASQARTISAVADSTNGNVITFTVKDRYGNPVKGANVTLSRVGTGFFFGGASTSTATTGSDGTVAVQFTGAGDVTGTLDTTTEGYDVAGQVQATALKAAVAGTTTGTGLAFSTAGVATATVNVAAGSDAASTNAQAAADAAAEATDAANAATDAANAAAEAADAATAAAQDAADAVAALSTQVSEMIDALKKQITALTNLVIKIQKKVKA